MESHNAHAAAHADDPLARVARLSRYARRLIETGPPSSLDAGIAHPFSAAEMRALLADEPTADEAGLKRVLRMLRRRVMLRLMARDLGGIAPLAEVVATATALAEVTISRALTQLNEWLGEQHGAPVGAESGRVQQLHVVGMGKLGGAELNVSSDIDLVLVYPEDGETRGPRVISNHEYFTRLGRRLIGALSEITADGHVFRVDMRLRPYGDGGPL
ncbi:MAG: bifunctional glutamine synthetase adenylyltransferase/deadenyltransferase, partial [Betaproteobacteria bacterium]|nr:bifunctional glutamine synthetase adenylyltransferase/deadenyltransferase [Betaproteobacteria bacterium]